MCGVFQALGVARGGGFNLGGFSEQRKMIEHLLHCLCELGTRHGCWPDLGKGLAEDELKNLPSI